MLGHNTCSIKKKRKCYFTTVPVRQQLQEILQRDGMLQKIGTNHMSLTMNTDGVPLYNSSSVSLWPLFLIINDLPPSERFLTQNLIIWGLWQGCGKPCFKTYLQPLVDELNELHIEGFDVNKQNIKASMTCCTMDLQAKAHVMEMVQHNGQYGCISCETPGEVFKQGKGHCRGYPVNEAPPRSADSILKNAEDAMNAMSKNVKGIKSVSVLFGLQYFDPVAAVVPEYMHGVLLGTTKKLLTLWFGKTSSKKEYYLGQHIQEIDRRLINMKPANRISRLPRKLEGNLSHLKASELQHWLLYYSIPCLQGFLPEEYLDNLCYLVDGIYLLLADSLNNEDIVQAEMSLAKFQISFQHLYGRENCGLNVHNIGCHLAEYSRGHGPLWAWSCFGFEDMNGMLVKSAHGTGDVSKHLLTSMFAHKQLCTEAQLIEDNNVKSFTMDMLSTGRRVKSLKPCFNCEIAGKSTPLNDIDLTQKVAENLQIPTGNVILKKVSRVRLQNGQLVSSRHYARQHKRICYAVLMANGDLGMVNFYLHEMSTDKCMANVGKCEIVGLLNPKVRHLIKVKETQNEIIIPVEEISEPVLFLCGNKDAICVSRLPNFHGHCG